MDLERLKKDRDDFKRNMSGPDSNEFYSEKKIKGDINNLLRFVAPDSYVTCYRSWILCDDGVVRPFIIEDSFGNKSVISKILGDRDNWFRGGILESVKDDITKKKKHIYEDEYPELMLKILYNGDRSGSKGNWKGVKNALFHVIDRDVVEDESKKKIYWCKENKHTMIIWLRPTAFTSFADMVENDGDPQEYDTNYKKTGAGTSTVHRLMKAGPGVAGAVSGPLTDEELSYTKYDLLEVSALTSAADTLRLLEKTITEIDYVLGTKYVDELKLQASMEKTAESIPPTQNTQPQVVVPSQPAPSAVEPQQPPVRTRVAAEKKYMIICRHDGCGASIPADSEICPSCNNPLVAPCDKCGKKFSVFDFSCPHCGTNYGQEAVVS